MEVMSPAHRALHLPPSPPDTAKNSRRASTSSEIEGGLPELRKLLTNKNTRRYPLPPPSKPDNKVLAEDLKTPDSHVVRDPRLIRLTGVHPFNVEAPLSDLYNEGFITTKDLHYVRNHGPVPRVEDPEVMGWEFSIEGLVEHPIRMTLAELLQRHEQLTYPVTLVCAGNRRKEQNMVRKSKGFSWGAAGLSTALWTGVAIGDLLHAAKPRRGARYVCFEGADKLPNGYYGTSIKLNWCMDPNRGVMVAHKMNGEPLPADHGRPLRIIIPGQIGGRSVKWLKRIIVTAEPSDNWYHIYDNRVLPTHITPEMSADMPEAWKDERHAIYDLNTNSATCFPAHDERIPLGGQGSVDKYNVRGYAYAGGGKRITRVEITLDKGKTWRPAAIRYPEDDYRLAPEGEQLYGGHVDMTWREASFCWCFWDVDIAVSDLQESDAIMVRAMDEAMMVQPKEMYWSVLGMMNNPWFRVVIHKEPHALRFEHPTCPALQPGGWMDRIKKAGGNLTNGNWGEKLAGQEEEEAVVEEPAKEICMISDKIKREITFDELKQHDGDWEPWFVLHGEVYDGTPFLEGHPGGAASIFGVAGQDATEEFLAIHSENAKGMMPSYHIGTLSVASRKLLESGEAADEAAEPRAVFLRSKAWSKAVLSRKTRLSADTKIFSFDLEHAAQVAGLPVGQHLMMRLREPATREAIIRAYTPVSCPQRDVGRIDVLVKIYRDSPDGGRPGGKMTQALDSLPLGHAVDFKGPVGKFEYLGRGLCSVSGRHRTVRRFVMVCGGSGVTPIFQVLRAVMEDPEDPTRCVVLDGNRAEEDVLCRAEMDALVSGGNATGGADRCRLVYTLSSPAAGWTGLKGRIDRALLESEVGKREGADGEELALICGPPPMESSVREILSSLGWDEDDMLFF